MEPGSDKAQTRPMMFVSAASKTTWCGKSYNTSSQQGLLDGYDDWRISADLQEYKDYPDIIKKTKLRPDLEISSDSSKSKRIIMVELTVPYKSRIEEAHVFKKERCSNLTKELTRAGFECNILPIFSIRSPQQTQYKRQ